MVLNKEMQEMLEVATNLGWECDIINQKTLMRKPRTYVEISQDSPAGEEIYMQLNFEPQDEKQATSFLNNLRDSVYTFDPDEHAEEWLPGLLIGDCSSSM